jgi:hypothetical protein
MWRRTRRAGSRFLLGLLVGGVAAGVLLSVPAYLVGSGLHAILPERWRIVFLAAVLAVLGGADLLRRTPHVWRQVPQRFIWKLPPGHLGLAWGFDMGLLFTTQKTTSLVWVAIAAVILLGPSTVALLLVAMAVTVSLVIALWSASGWIGGPGFGRDPRWQGWVRQASGTLILALSALTALRVWHP